MSSEPEVKPGRVLFGSPSNHEVDSCLAIAARVLFGSRFNHEVDSCLVIAARVLFDSLFSHELGRQIMNAFHTSSPPFPSRCWTGERPAGQLVSVR